MSRGLMVSAVLLFSAGTAGGAMSQGTPVSYYVDVPGANGVLIPSIPDGGFVLTDIVVDTYNCEFSIREDGVKKALFQQNVDTDNNGFWNFESGIPFAAGSEVTMTSPHTGLIRITICGYIPSPPSGYAAAIGNTGLVVLAVLVLAAGGHVMRKRRPMHA